MKKILVLISVFVLISCQNEIAETSKESDHVNNDKGIINPLDPDMHVTCPWWPSPASSYQDPNIVYGKDYLVRNLTSDTIRVKMYILPKFAISPTNFVATSYNFMIQDLVYYPNDCRFRMIMPNIFKPSAPGTQYGPTEIWDHFIDSDMGVDLFWQVYPGSLNEVEKFRPAFIEFWIQDHKNPTPQHHWLALEDINSFIHYTSMSGIKSLFPSALPFPKPAPISYYLLDNELNPTYGPTPYQVYYIMGGVSNTATDNVYNINATFKYMPNMGTPNYPHLNPDTTPGYIIKFESF